MFKDGGAQATLASPNGGQPPLDPKSDEPDAQSADTDRFRKDTIPDMSLFAYTSRADEAQLPLLSYPRIQTWIERVKTRPGFLPMLYPYSIDPYSAGELP